MRLWLALALACGCDHTPIDVHDAAAPVSEAGDATPAAVVVADAAPDAIVIDAARPTRRRQLGKFPRDVEEADFREYVEIPNGTLALSFTLSEALDCHEAMVQVDSRGPHAPVSIVLERGSTVIARDVATCDGARYCSKTLARSSLARGAYVVELANDGGPVTARVTIDTCHGLE